MQPAGHWVRREGCSGTGGCPDKRRQTALTGVLCRLWWLWQEKSRLAQRIGDLSINGSAAHVDRVAIEMVFAYVEANHGLVGSVYLGGKILHLRW